MNIKTEVCNSEEKEGTYRLLTQVLAPDGQIVTSVETKETIAGRSSRQISQTTEALDKPQLWNLSTPVLYKIASKLYKGEQLIDEEETTLAFVGLSGRLIEVSF